VVNRRRKRLGGFLELIPTMIIYYIYIPLILVVNKQPQQGKKKVNQLKNR
jgi:hypothetical protein